MFQFFADENFNNDIVRGLLLRQPDTDLLRIQDTEILGADDPAVLEWAGTNNRIILTHDRATMPNFAYRRVASGKPMPGVFAISDRMQIAEVITELLLVINCSDAQEWDQIVLYFPV